MSGGKYITMSAIKPILKHLEELFLLRMTKTLHVHVHWPAIQSEEI